MTSKDKFLPYGRQSVGEEEIESVVEVLRGDWLTTGPKVKEFEEALCAVTGANRAVVCSSGTAALHIAAIAARLGPGTVSIVPSMTFLATANAIRLTGGDVCFCDVDPETGLMTPGTLREALDRARSTEQDIRAVLPVHLTGQSCDMEGISAIAREAKLTVIEDAAHALGADYAIGQEGGKVGNGRYGEMTVLSMHPVKSIATGEGGAVTTNDTDLAARLELARNHGMQRDTEAMVNKDMAFATGGELNPWYYEMHELAPNYRLTDIQCAMGLAQLKKLEGFITRRRALARRYQERLRDLSPLVRPVPECSPGTSAFHLFVIHIDYEAAGSDRASIMSVLRERGIGTQVHYIPVHTQPYYQKLYGAIELPGAETYYRGALSLPIFTDMADGDVDRVVSALREALKA